MGLPLNRHIGVEHEYKWLLRGEHKLDAVPPPPGYHSAEQWESVQRNLYFDDSAGGLTEADVSMTLVLFSDAAWLTCKDTLQFEGGRRDALEVEQRLDRGQLATALQDTHLLPLQYLRRRGHREPLLTYATAHQRRWKVRFVSDDDRVLALSLDTVLFRPARLTNSSDQRSAEQPAHATQWLEVETDRLDEAVVDLDRWAGDITAALDSPPFLLSKPRYAAKSQGWWSAPSDLDAHLTEGVPRVAATG